MRLAKTAVIFMICVAVAVLITSCNQPEYYHPYGEGVDPDTVTTGEFITRTTTVRTTSPTQVTTTTALQQGELIIPEGYRICPECEGVKILCEECEGTGEVLGEVHDPEVYVDYYEPCENCSSEDPGYYFCETCRNELIIEE